MPPGRLFGSFKVKSREEFESAIDEYFSDKGAAWSICYGNDGSRHKEYRPTMSGLALKLGVDRRTLCNYKHTDEYGDLIALAKAHIEDALEQRLYGSAVTGVIFSLKNGFDWRDKNEVEYSEKVKDDGKNEW